MTEHSKFAFFALFGCLFYFISLLSFAKYLELLIYSTAIHSSSVCEHTMRNSPDESDPSGPNFRSNFLRHFSTDTCNVTFSLAEERDIFQLHLPRLQICRTRDKISHPMCPENCQGSSQADEERSVLRRQIRAYWEAVSDHLDKIVSVCMLRLSPAHLE